MIKTQIGFKKNHRTSDHLLTLKDIVKKNITIGKKKKLFTCFVDFKKAYDSLWHDGLFYKLFISITDFFKFTKGVRQGCPLSPILFNLYVNDTFDRINKGTHTDVVIYEHTIANALMFADDLILISHSQEGLQNQIDILNDYCRRGNKLLKANIHLNNVLLENVKSFKYLGFSISAKNCSFSKTLEDLGIKTNRDIFSINNKCMLSQLPTKLARKIFPSQIIPIILYGVPMITLISIIGTTTVFKANNGI